MGTVELLVLLARALSVGVPAIIEAVGKFQTTSGREPTVDEIMAITSDLRPPGDYR